MQLRTAVIGTDGAGKTTFCYAFSKFAEKRGLQSAVCNLNPALKHLQYPVSWDVRSLVRAKSGDLRKAYSQIAGDGEAPKAVRALKANLALLDFAGGLDLFLVGDSSNAIKRLAGNVLFLADAAALKDGLSRAALEEVAGLLSDRLEMPVLAVVNKSDSLRKSKTRGRGGLAGFESQRAAGGEGVFFVSATERSGFEELLDELKKA